MKLPFPQRKLRDIAELLINGNNLIGWHRYTSTYRTISAFYNKKYGIVLKRPHFILEHNTPTELRLPTTEIGDGWVVQPIVRKTDLKEACNDIRKRLGNTDIFPDIHVGNVGWWNGRAYLFDW